MPESSSGIHRILIVDPEDEFLEWAARHLAAPDVVVHTERDAARGFAWSRAERPSLVIADLALSPFSGLELLSRLRLEDPGALVILYCGSPPSSALIEAMRLGCYDFLRKSALAYDLRPVVESALQTAEAIRETSEGSGSAGPRAIDPGRAGETLIGDSPAMQEVFKLVGRVSRSDVPVLITGESGCGKEVVARAVHQFSPRSAKPFVAINCAAIPENLLESELFGHEKGSFTGAMQRRIGRFEQCGEGTLFLDEVAEMPVLIQSKLLRVLQEGEFSRVGGNETLRTNARILAATNRDPERAIAEGAFREDLFYRLNVVRIHLPPLRERAADIRPLASFFLSRLSRERGGRALRFSEAALDLLESYNWPGNVRELENVIHRAAVLTTGDILMPKDLPVAPLAGDSHRATDAVLDHFLSAAARGHGPALSGLRRALEERALLFCSGNAEQAARLVGRDRGLDTMNPPSPSSEPVEAERFVGPTGDKGLPPSAAKKKAAGKKRIKPSGSG